MEVFVLAEHRQGQIREITFEMLTKGKEIAEKTNSDLTAVILGKNIRQNAFILSKYATKVLLCENPSLKDFNSDTYQKVLTKLMQEHKPLLTIIGHTSFGVDLAPRLATVLGFPLATDCIDLGVEDTTLKVTRQMYGGKVNVDAKVRKSLNYIVTIRPGSFSAKKSKPVNGQIVKVSIQIKEETKTKRFIRYVSPPLSEVDITEAEKLVAVGRGIKELANLPLLQDLTNLLGAVMACSRPIVDKGWLSVDREVGSSGKIVRPKLYIAIGISGAFQHVLGMKKSNLVIAINKDPNAPIFNFADYGIVEDFRKIIPNLITKLQTES